MKTEEDEQLRRAEELSRAMFDKFGYVSPTIISEIQRNAREGTVPESDVRKLVEGLQQIAVAGNAEMPNLPRVTGGAMRTTKFFAEDLLTDLRAKHPNLFTK